MNIEKITSKVHNANTSNNALRCGLPKSVADALNITAGDSIKWIIIQENNKTTVTVEKLIL